MNDQQLTAFATTARDYFKAQGLPPAEIGNPFLMDLAEPVVYHYTGLIGINGSFSGCIYYTAPKAMLSHLLVSLGDLDSGEDTILDLVGEVANVLSGNVRRVLGENFLITPPLALKGEPEHLRTPMGMRPYVVPIRWKSYHAALVVCIEAEHRPS